MTASSTSPAPPVVERIRRPLRLRMAEHRGRSRLDGGWWPYSRDLAVELADLVDHLPAGSSRVLRALVSPPDWDSAPRRIPISGGDLKVGSFPDDDSHLVLLTTVDRKVLRILVVPPSFNPAQGEEALLAAGTSGNTHSAAELLNEVVDHADVDPQDLWAIDGGVRTAREGGR